MRLRAPIESGTCSSAAAPVEIPAGSFTSPMVQPGAPMAGAASIGTQAFTTIADDLIMFGDPPIDLGSVGQDDGASTLVVGHLDRATGTFTQWLALDRCPATSARTDGRSLWLLARTGPTTHTLVEVDLQTGTPTWKRSMSTPVWWSTDGEVVRLALGGVVDGGSDRAWPAFGIETLEKGTGRIVGSVDVQAEAVEAMASDSALWVRTTGSQHADDPYREVDLDSGAILRSTGPTRTEAPGSDQQPVIQDGAIWRPVTGGIERRPLDTLVPQFIGAPTYPGGYLRMVAGPGGVWTIGMPGPGLTVAVSRIDTATATLQGTFTYLTYAAVGDSTGVAHPAVPQLQVDAHGARTRAPTLPYDGTGEPPPFTYVEIVIP